MTRVLTALLLVLSGSAASAEAFRTLPDRMLTPGLTVEGMTLHTICTTRWGDDARAVSPAMKQHVRDVYHFNVRTCPRSRYQKKLMRRVEIDHLVPRSLGGADDERNLWPQCYELTKKNKSLQDDGAHKKDRLEAFLHKDVCTRKSTDLLQTYQRKIKENWLNLYHSIYDRK
jgi:hypothetical protein